jgi:hypothetical protein
MILFMMVRFEVKGELIMSQDLGLYGSVSGFEIIGVLCGEFMIMIAAMGFIFYPGAH